MANTGREGQQKRMQVINLKAITTYRIIKGMGLDRLILNMDTNRSCHVHVWEVGSQRPEVQIGLSLKKDFFIFLILKGRGRGWMGAQVDVEDFSLVRSWGLWIIMNNNNITYINIILYNNKN